MLFGNFCQRKVKFWLFLGEKLEISVNLVSLVWRRREFGKFSLENTSASTFDIRFCLAKDIAFTKMCLPI